MFHAVLSKQGHLAAVSAVGHWQDVATHKVNKLCLDSLSTHTMPLQLMLQ